MPTITVGAENSGSIDLYYEDHGSGRPVVLIHGYPLSGRAWDKQLVALLDAGRRVITYDRRGFGKSSQPTSGYDYDTFAADLSKLLEQLDLKGAALVGHSMGSGEVTRYRGAYGSARVERAVLVSPLQPFLLQADDNPEGIPKSVFDGFVQAAKADMPAWMTAFFNVFFGTGAGRDAAVSDEALQADWNVAVSASAIAAAVCIPTWGTDFRADLAKIDVPILVVQGDADQALPIDKTGRRIPAFLKDAQLVEIKGGSHGIPWTHAEQVNSALLRFMDGSSVDSTRMAASTAK
jgi:non-heme chloroperoxidase